VISSLCRSGLGEKVEEALWFIVENQKNLKSVLSLIQIFAIHLYRYSHFSKLPLLK